MMRLFSAKSHWEPSPLRKTISYTLLGLWAFICLFPLYWLIITSFKLPSHVAEGPFYFPWVDFEPSLHAWRDVLVNQFNDTLRPYINSIIIALSSSVLALLFGSLASYALVRIEYKPRVGSVVLFVLSMLGVILAVTVMGVPWQIAVVSGIIVFFILLAALRPHFKRSLGNHDIEFWMISQRILPPVTVVIPLYVLFQQMGMLDSYWSIIIAYTAGHLPIAVWLMRDFFKQVPVSIEESAKIDGATRYRIFFSLIVPLTLPGLAATFLLILILTWNEYIYALFLSTANTQTMPMLVSAQNATRGPQWWTMSVLILIMITPVMIMARFLYRLVVGGLFVGAEKG